jgi:hypothetical protein
MATAMKFSMIVEMTSCAPRKAFSAPGRRAPEHAACRTGHGAEQDAGRTAELARHDVGPERAHDQLAVAADVEQAAAEREGHREARQDQRRPGHDGRDQEELRRAAG